MEELLYFDGGPALNKGLVASLEDELGKRLVIPEFPQVTTAYGAAIIGQESYQFEKEEGQQIEEEKEEKKPSASTSSAKPAKKKRGIKEILLGKSPLKPALSQKQDSSCGSSSCSSRCE